ncbi:MAG: hypothetical protein ACRC9L_05935 [Brevinema sp.]
MLKYPISYTDFNGNTHTEDLWFHVSKTSVLMAKDDVYATIINLGKDLQQRAKFVEEAQQNLQEGAQFSQNNLIVADAIRSMARLLDKVLDLAYGIRSEDGMRFVKNDKILEDWKQTVAYDALIDKLLSNPQEMISFIEKLMKQ